MASRFPTIVHVKPGAAVSIILKQDQPTGRQVQGVVADLLTRGNHPRGIKVRLQDGRIGRVQGMVDAAAVSIPDAATLQQDLQDQSVARRGGGHKPYRSERLGIRYTDVRLDQGGDEPPTEMDLMAFVKPARAKRGGARKNGSSAADRNQDEAMSSVAPTGSQTLKCPVCNDFEGDEAAVAHHVDSHFG